MAVLASPAGLADVTLLDLVDRVADRLAVGDLRLADIRVDLELAQHPVDQHLKVELAHAGDDRLAGLLVGADSEGRVLLGLRAKSARDSLSWSALVFGSTATWMTGSGNVSDSSTIGCATSQSVSPVVVALSPTTATMSPV